MLDLSWRRQAVVNKTPERKSVKYPILWVRAELDNHELWAGFCGKTGKIYSFSDALLEVLIVRDFYVSHGCCEEAKRCLCFACPLNKSSPSTWLDGRGGGQGEVNPGYGDIGVSDFGLEKYLKEGKILTGPDGAPFISIEHGAAE